MINVQYMLTSPAIEGHLFFEYDKAGVIKQFVNATTKPLTDTQQNWLAVNFPATVNMLEIIAGTSKTMQIKQVVIDYSFDTFWEAYGYKVGNKPRVKKLWDALDRDDQIKVLDCIPGYVYYLKMRPTMERLYAETFLAQRRFETDYKALAKAK